MTGASSPLLQRKTRTLNRQHLSHGAARVRGWQLALVLGWLAIAAHGVAAQEQDRPLDAGFPEVYWAGGLDAPEWAMFSGTQTMRMAFDASGNLFVLNPDESRIVVIGPDGELVRTVGSAGEGPGEFNLVVDMVVWRDGRIVVADAGHNAYQVFGPDGELERFVRMATGQGPLAAMSGMTSALRADPVGGTLIAQGPPDAVGSVSTMIGNMFGAQPDTPTRVDDRGLERLDLSGEIVVAEPILEAWPIPREDPDATLTLANPSDISRMVAGMVASQTEFEPRLVWDVMPDGTIAYSDSSAYAIKLTDTGGSTATVLRRALHPEAVTGAIRTATIAYRSRNSRRSSRTTRGRTAK